MNEALHINDLLPLRVGGGQAAGHVYTGLAEQNLVGAIALRRFTTNSKSNKRVIAIAKHGSFIVDVSDCGFYFPIAMGVVQETSDLDSHTNTVNNGDAATAMHSGDVIGRAGIERAAEDDDVSKLLWAYRSAAASDAIPKYQWLASWRSASPDHAAQFHDQLTQVRLQHQQDPLIHMVLPRQVAKCRDLRLIRDAVVDQVDSSKTAHGEILTQGHLHNRIAKALLLLERWIGSMVATEYAGRPPFTLVFGWCGPIGRFRAC